MVKQIILFFCLITSVSSSAQRTIGLFVNEEQSFEGYTLFAPSSSTITYLIDNCGKQVHYWESDTRPGLAAYLLENGLLLRTGLAFSTTFAAGGIGGKIELLDWESNLVWETTFADSLYHQHHDIEYLPNGNILVLAWEYHSRDEAIANGRNLNFLGNALWSEAIFEIKPVGTNEAEIVWEWHLWDHIIQEHDSSKLNFGLVQEHPEKVDLNFVTQNASTSDWIHANSVDYNPVLDQIILNSRNFSELWIIDHSTTTAEAATDMGGQYGKGGDLLYRWGNPNAYDRGTSDHQTLFRQHDSHWIPDSLNGGGQIMIYNNFSSTIGNSRSSVDIISPPVDSVGNYFIDPITNRYGPDSALYKISPEGDNSFFAPNVSGAQRLPNGNTLICAGTGGKFLEFDSSENLVWEYINPVNTRPLMQGTNPTGNSVFRTYRYPIDYPAFNNRLIISGDPIEINPLPSPCNTTSISALDFEDFKVFPNPFNSHFQIKWEYSKPYLLEIFRPEGQLIYSQQINGDTHFIATENWTPGFYIISVDRQQFSKLLKL